MDEVGGSKEDSCFLLIKGCGNDLYNWLIPSF